MVCVCNRHEALNALNIARKAMQSQHAMMPMSLPAVANASMAFALSAHTLARVHISV